MVSMLTPCGYTIEALSILMFTYWPNSLSFVLCFMSFIFVVINSMPQMLWIELNLA